MPVPVLYIVGAVLNAMLLLLPLALADQPGRTLGAPLVIFLVLATAFFLTDATTVAHKGATYQAARADRRFSYLALLTGVLILDTFWICVGEQALRGEGEFNWLNQAGGVMMLCGIFLRYNAIRTLGSLFGNRITVCCDQPLIRTGIYGFLRHPSETGLLLVALGAGGLLGSPWGAALVTIGLAPIVLWRVSLEDRQLETAFGEQFRMYRRRVQALVPFVY